MDSWTPWKWYPEIWKTEAKFWQWLRGNLRKAVWNTSPIKITFKNQNVSKPEKGYTGKAKSGARCALTGEWLGKSKLVVDHIEGHVPLTSEEDILDFLKHLIPPKGALQLVDPEAHKIKNYADSRGISFEEAMKAKAIIRIMKGPTNWLNGKLIYRGYKREGISNATKRKVALGELYDKLGHIRFLEELEY